MGKRPKIGTNLKIGPRVHSRFYNIWDCVISALWLDWKNHHQSSSSPAKLVVVSMATLGLLKVHLFRKHRKSKLVRMQFQLKVTSDNEENWGVEGEHRWLVIQRQLHLVLIICLLPFGKYKLNVENWAMIVSSWYHVAITARAQLSYSTMTLDCQPFWFHHHHEDFEPFVDFPLCRDLLFGDVCILWPENQNNINHNHDHFHFELELNCIVFHLHYATFFMPLEAGRRPKRRNRNFFRLMFWLRWFILLTVMSNW